METDHEALNGFSVDDWAAWLSLVTAGQDAVPPFPRYAGRELDKDIVTLFAHLSLATAERFRAGLRRAFESTPVFPMYSRQLFWLLQILSAIKAATVVDYLDQLIRNEASRRISYANETIHAAALNARAKFGVTEPFATYLIDSAHRFRDYDHALLAFRLTAQMSAYRALNLLPLLAQLAPADPIARHRRELQSGRQILALAKRHQYHDLTRWLVFFLEKQPDVSTLASVLAILAQQLSHMPTAVEASHSYKIVYFAVVRGAVEPLKPRDVVEVARQHVTLGSQLTSAALRCMWNLQIQNFPDDLPWGYMPYDHPYLRNANRAVADKRDTVFKKGAPPEYVEPERESAIAQLLRPFAYVRRKEPVPAGNEELHVSS